MTLNKERRTKCYLFIFRKIIFLFDAIALGVFTIIGFEIGRIQAEFHPVICILLGLLCASFCDVIRDILFSEAPLIYHKEVYASLSIIGAITLYLLLKTALPIKINYVVTSTLIVVLRILAVKYHWVLPNFYKKET